jgi:hypothetical protein
VQNSISIPFGKGNQATTLLSSIERLRPGTIPHRPEEIARHLIATNIIL